MNKKINLNGKQRFLDALNCIATDRPPIWMMRQAGRSLPEYRELKKELNFTDLVQNPELLPLKLHYSQYEDLIMMQQSYFQIF